MGKLGDPLQHVLITQFESPEVTDDRGETEAQVCGQRGDRTGAQRLHLEEGQI